MAWTRSLRDTLSLPLNSLAMEVLRDFRAGGGWNRDSWIKGTVQTGAVSGPAVEKAFAEAWSWLEARGLVAWDPSQQSANARFVTRLGEEALSGGVQRMEAAARLGMQLHPRIAERVERQFLLGEYELAVFSAMKEVEVRVREMGGFPADLVGVGLMQSAFNPTGPLTDESAEGGERVATMELFKGAMGVFKNPSSHRPVNYDDPTEAAEIVLFADLLHRMLDRIERKR